MKTHFMSLAFQKTTKRYEPSSSNGFPTYPQHKENMKCPMTSLLKNALRVVLGLLRICKSPLKPFDVWAARVIREQKWHRTQVIESDEGDRIVVSFLLDSTVEFKRWILGFGPCARVIEPQETIDEIVAMLHSSLQMYKEEN